MYILPQLKSFIIKSWKKEARHSHSKLPEPGLQGHPGSAECFLLCTGPCAHPTPPSLSAPFLLLVLTCEFSLSFSTCQIPSIPEVKLPSLEKSCHLLFKTLPNSDQSDTVLLWFLLHLVCVLRKYSFALQHKINAQILAKAEYTVHIIESPSRGTGA